ncbi:MAG TPA: hypothetical protein VIK72_19315 [Clostridiaceae bacterium]
MKDFLTTEEIELIDEASKNKDWELLSLITHTHISRLKAAEKRKRDDIYKNYTISAVGKNKRRTHVIKK